MRFRVLSTLLLAALLQSVQLQAAATARLVADLNTSGSAQSPGTGYVGEPLLPLRGKILFSAYEAGSGAELWGSDGTDAGTAMVRDLCAGPCSSNPQLLGTAGGAGQEVAVFFSKLDVASDSPGELWRTDGTRDGTFQIAAAAPCTRQPPQPVAIGGNLFFTAAPGESDGQCALWRTDGTATGTLRLASFYPSFIYSQVQSEAPVQAGNRLFFFVPDFDQVSLWTTDGSLAGTRLVRSFPAGDEILNDFPRYLAAIGNQALFLARGEKGGSEQLWRSDGTPAGTQAVTHFAAPNPFAPTRFLKVFDGVVYFVADDVSAGQDLFRSDGTTAGTRRVTDFGYAFPFGQEFSIGPEQMTKAGGRLFFLATDGLTGWRIWTSGGTPATTAPLAGCPGGCPAVTPATPLAAAGSRAVFAASDPAHGSEPWSTDGTGAGTRLLRDACPGSCGSDPTGFFPFRGKLVFIAGATGRGEVLWTTDGTPQGTSELAVPGSVVFSWRFNPVLLGQKLFFTVADPLRGSQLWTSDGTPQGSGLVTLVGSGPGSAPFGLTAFGNDLMFGACDGTGTGVWRSGGTASSTALLEPTRFECSYPPADLTAAGGLVFFRGGERSPGRLWRSDGTDAGTFPLSPDVDLPLLGNLVPFRGKAIFLATPQDSTASSLWESDGSVAGTHRVFDLTEAGLSGASNLTALGQSLYFVGTTDTDIGQLWSSDGAAAGTRQLTSFADREFFSGRVPEMVQVGATVFFTPAGFDLWKTDGTAAGTSQVLPFPSSTEGRGPVSLTPFHGALYFIANTAQGRVGRGLWRSDGTAVGTVLVKAVGTPADFFHQAPAWLTVVGDRLFFVADDGDHGVELWRSDGTPDGTVLVRDIAPGSATSQPRSLVAAGGLLFFTADDGVHGFELWQSDGTAAGTRMVQDIAPGALSSNPEELTPVGGRLYFRADDGVHGSELWTLALASSGCQPSGTVLCLGGGRYQVEAAWRDPQGNTGSGHAVPLTADTGTFWFFDPANVEAVLKVLDGQGVNGHVWVFYGALSNVEYTLTVTDTQTGAARLYRNPPGRLASVADTHAFGPLGATGTGASPGPAGAAAEMLATASQGTASGGCTASATRLCLQGGRFAVEANWTDFQGKTGTGTAVPLAGGDTGYFWFFGPDNLEVILKVLDGRPVNGKLWVFYGALSNVGYTLNVTDTQTGKVKTYTNPRGRLASVADTGAF